MWLATSEWPDRAATAHHDERCVGASFGAPGEVVFEGDDKATLFIYRIKEDGSELQKMIPTSNLFPFGVSPDGRWIAAQDSRAWGALSAYPGWRRCSYPHLRNCSPPQGTDPRPPDMNWTSGRKIRVFEVRDSTYAIPLQPGQLLPPIPAGGFQSKEAVAALPGARLISETSTCSRSQPFDLRVRENHDAAQHLPRARAVRRTPSRGSAFERHDEKDLRLTERRHIVANLLPSCAR